MDTEKGEETPKVSKFETANRLKAYFPAKKILAGFVLLVCLLAVMFGMGVLAAEYTKESRYDDSTAAMGENSVADGGRALFRRDQVDGASYPISTKTALSTIYGVSHPPNVFTKVETVTGTTYVTVPGDEVHISVSVATIESTAEVCEVEVVTMTESYTITVTPNAGEDDSATSAALPEATVIGNPSTVTNVQTELSVTSGLPDATVPGSPGTVTDVETNYSLTSGLPDATISGNPDTVTNVQTDYSVSSGLPDATVPGNPLTVTDQKTDYSVSTSLPDATVPGNPLTVTDVQESFSVTGSFHTVITVTDLYPPKQDMSTVTTVTTIQRTLTTHNSIVTVTVTDLYQGSTSVASVSASSTFTKIVFETFGEASTSTKTIQVPTPPYPTLNNTIATGPSGTITAWPTPTTPIVISGGTKKPEPRGWGGSSGTTNLGCAIMLIATIMFLL
ncbi:hypothetical protein NM208_g13219 [Fusarium decemcellulare]|uniref:Uncharacterized protein n=1 Tax=Fusarium decemcellulare TaxID=57161 RepID=A0ACC1RKM1_9HYPO|nr:hypothetical protein NM208_g13219 [Fusarium decemcellulare]